VSDYPKEAPVVKMEKSLLPKKVNGEKRSKGIKA
jgi:hypothetical protein